MALASGYSLRYTLSYTSSYAGGYTVTAEKTRETRLRRMAERQGLVLRKSRRRDPRALDFGTFGLYDANRNVLEVGDPSTGFGLTDDEVEVALMEGRR
jgi:hypothetical protein